MALVVKDRIKETTATTGTGTLTLAGAVTKFQDFSVIGDGNTTYYAIESGNGTDWEVGVGTYTASGTTLSRDTILESSNAGSAINLSGTSTVFCTYPAERSVNTADIGATIQAYDATILKSADIGTSVQGYDADTAKYDDTTANFTGNLQKSGANVLTANQTITLSGDATGSGTTAITVTVVDDSHNHIISNVDGLQTALDGKQPVDADLTTIAGLAKTDGNFIVGDGTNWVAESGATARTSLGLGSLATLNTVGSSQIDNSAVTQAKIASGVAGTGPAFSATVSTNQTVTSSTFTKVQFPVEDFDTNSNYDNSTNYRFTPTVAGYYQINSNVSVNDNNETAWIMIYKNGSVYIAGSRVNTDASVIANKISQVAGLVYLDGSTDYVEIYVYHTTSPNTTLNSVPAYCRFSGYLARAT